jgi:hypothetical protein
VGIALLGLVLNAQLLAALGTGAAGGAGRFEAVAQLLDPVERAALAPAAETVLRLALHQALQSVFLLMALAALLGLAVVWLLPGGRAADQATADQAASDSPAPIAARPAGVE